MFSFGFLDLTGRDNSGLLDELFRECNKLGISIAFESEAIEGVVVRGNAGGRSQHTMVC